MLRIVIATSRGLFQGDGPGEIARELAAACDRAGHAAALLVLPRPPLGAEFRAHLAAWLTGVRRDEAGNRTDRLISLAYPAFALRHPRHVAWLGKRNEEYYEKWPETASRLTAGRRLNARFHRYIMGNFDNYFLQRNVARLFAQTPQTARLLERHHQLDPVPVLPVPAVGAAEWDDVLSTLLAAEP